MSNEFMVERPTLPDVGYLSLKEVMALFPVSKSTIYQMIKDGKFPEQEKISTRRVAWSAKKLRLFLSKGDVVPEQKSEEV